MRYFWIILLIAWSDAAWCEEIHLRFWHFSIDEELSRPLIEEFEKEHPHIKIHIQQLSWDFGHDKIVTSLIADNAPDIFEIGSTWGPKFAQSGVLKEITTDIAPFQHEYMMWEPVTFENKVYGMPWLIGTRFILYNKDLFKKAGLDPRKPPTTWDELYQDARKINGLSKNIHGYGIAVAEDFTPWQTFIPYIWNAGGEILSADWKQSRFESPEVSRAFHFYKKLKTVSLLNRQEQIDQIFSENRIGIIFTGAWIFNAIARANASLNYGVAQVPTPEKHQTPISFGGGEMLVMLQKTRHPKEAFLFMRYLTSQKVELTIAKKQRNILPSRREALRDPAFQKDPKMKAFADQMLHTKAPPAHPQWFSIGKIISSSVDKAMLQDEPIQSVVSSASAQINSILNHAQQAGKISDKRLTGWIVCLMLFLILGIGLTRPWKAYAAEPSTWIFLSPWIISFVVFGLYPLLYSFVISFADYNILTSRFSWSGLSNYLQTLQDPEFLKAVAHTLFFAAGTIPFTVTFSLLLAVLIHQGVPWKSFFQAGFFLPTVTSIIVIATLFTYFYAENGFLNYFLSLLRLPSPAPAWLINKQWALLAIMAMAVWSSVGYFLILFLAGLQSIPQSLYEASRMDGANAVQQFFKITLPQLKPIILFVIVINTINSLQVFPEIFAMTKGGPARSTTTIVYYLYEKGFSEFQMGTASAIAYLLALLIGFFAYYQMKMLKEKP